VPVDFDALVLKPCEDTFSRPITVTPLMSQPGQPSYAARGIYTKKPVDVATEGGAVFSDHQPTLGIRYSEFQVKPLARDLVAIPAYLQWPVIGNFEIITIDDDSEGHGRCWLRRLLPTAPQIFSSLRLATGSPGIDTPQLTQLHELTVSPELASGSPALDTPVMS